MPQLDAQTLDLIFRNARTYSAFRPEPVADSTLQRIYPGYGDPSKLFPGNPRLTLAEACKVI